MLETLVWSSPTHCEDEGVEAQSHTVRKTGGGLKLGDPQPELFPEAQVIRR